MEKKKLRILSYNIHKGFSSGNRKFILKEIRNALCEVHPDVVFLQEVHGEHNGHRVRIKNWPVQSQFEYLAHELWPHFAYGKNAVYVEGHHGNAILSKYPILTSENIDVSTNQFERRGLLHASVQVPGISKTVHLLCVHLGLVESERSIQIQRICSRVQSHVPVDASLVIGGDFNDWRCTASSILEKRLQVTEVFKAAHGKYARTFPSWLPALRLDRIYCRGFKVPGVRCLNENPWLKLSDHVPLLSEMVPVRA